MQNCAYRILQLLFMVGFGAIVATGVVISLPKYRHVCDLNTSKEKILKRIEEKRAEIQEIKSKQTRFNTDREFVEKLAREHRQVFPGELVFVFDD